MSTLTLVNALKTAGQDFEFYPTTDRMVDAILRDLGEHDRYSNDIKSFLDIGAGDGRVLMQFGRKFENAKLYSIEKSPILQQAQNDRIVPVGAEFEQQNLMMLPADVVFSNPPYSDFEQWVYTIITTAHAQVLYFVIPQRWETSAIIAAALKERGAKADILTQDSFYDGERQARAVVHIIRVKLYEDHGRWGRSKASDPFDAWFDANVGNFDAPKEVKEEQSAALERINKMGTIPEMVESYNTDYARMEANYKAIFTLDGELLRELGVSKEGLREGLKKRIQGLKNVYWEALFRKLEAITSRLTTKTKKGFLERLTGQTSVGFTVSNCYQVVIWAIKAANQYFDVQVVDVFRTLSTGENVMNYKSNLKTWNADGWRYMRYGRDGLDGENVPRNYALDYRIVVDGYYGIRKGDTGTWDYPGDLHRSCHELNDDLVAVFGNLGFRVKDGQSSWNRQWTGGQWQDFTDADGNVVFQSKAYMNGNMHFRIMPDAIKALNVEAGRLLGWLKSPADVVTELGYSEDMAVKFFGSNRKLGGAMGVKLLSA